MMTHRWLAGLCLTLVLFTGDARGDIAPEDRGIFLGNSITLGHSPVTLTTADGWVGLLQRAWPHFHLVNAGCAGGLLQVWNNDTQDPRCWWGSAWRVLAQPFYPARFTHILSTSGQLANSLPVAEWEIEMRTLIAKIPGPVILSMQHDDIRHTDPFDPVKILTAGYFDAINRIVADTPDVYFGVDLRLYIDHAEHLEDTIHLNAMGNVIAASVIQWRLWLLGFLD